MSHDIECKNGVWSFVYSPQEGAAWHKLGVELPDTASSADWRAAAGHNFTVSKRQLYFAGADGQMKAFDDRFGMVRDDTQYPLGIGSGVYKITQPAQINDICDEFASYDAKLGRSAAFVLRKGDLICSTYAYRDTVTVGGDTHKAYLMASTSFDGSSATRFWIALVRAVCANTIAAGLAESDAIVTVRHNTKLVASKVQEQLATLAQSVERYKAIGDMLAAATLSAQEIAFFLRDVLDIPRDASPDDVSTKKKNQRQAIIDAMQITANERGKDRATGYDAFTVLQGLTRYVDHDRAVRDTANGADDIARFDSANFGSGQTMKIGAVTLLQNLLKEREKVAA